MLGLKSGSVLTCKSVILIMAFVYVIWKDFFCLLNVILLYHNINFFGGRVTHFLFSNLKSVGKQYMLFLEIYLLWNFKLQYITLSPQPFSNPSGFHSSLTPIIPSFNPVKISNPLTFFFFPNMSFPSCLFLSTSYLDSTIHYLPMFLPMNRSCFLVYESYPPSKSSTLNQSN